MAIRAVRPRQLSRSLDFSGVRVETARLRSDRAVTTFWRWWAEGGRRRATAALDSGDARRVVPEITSLIEVLPTRRGIRWRGEWTELPHTRARVVTALRAHATQVRVADPDDADGIVGVHSGGQRETIPLAVGLRRSTGSGTGLRTDATHPTGL